MKVKTLSALAGLGGALILSGSADAAYIGLGTQVHSTGLIGGVSRTVYRVYAVFDSPNDYVSSVAGSDILGPATIQSRNADDTAFGSNFFNAGGGSTAPLTSKGAFVGGPNAQWDSFATIGAETNDVNIGDDDQTSTSPGFPTFITGTNLTGNFAWFTPGPLAQGKASASQGVYFNSALANPIIAGHGVLIMQLTVNAGGNVRGTVAPGVNINGGAGVSIANQAFNTAIPAPGALALLGLAGLVGARRRRA